MPGFLGVNFSPLALAGLGELRASALVAMVLLANLVRSRIGRSWRAVRDDEVAAALAGINVARMQILAFIVSAACAGLGGVLLAVVVGTVSPSLFTLSLSIQLLTAAVLGGLGSLSGAIWGGILLVIVPTYLDQLRDQPRPDPGHEFVDPDPGLRRRADRRDAGIPARHRRAGSRRLIGQAPPRIRVIRQLH